MGPLADVHWLAVTPNFLLNCQFVVILILGLAITPAVFLIQYWA